MSHRTPAGSAPSVNWRKNIVLVFHSWVCIPWCRWAKHTRTRPHDGHAVSSSSGDPLISGSEHGADRKLALQAQLNQLKTTWLRPEHVKWRWKGLEKFSNPTSCALHKPSHSPTPMKLSASFGLTTATITKFSESSRCQNHLPYLGLCAASQGVPLLSPKTQECLLRAQHCCNLSHMFADAILRIIL